MAKTHTFYVIRTKQSYRTHGGMFNEYYDFDTGWYLKKRDGWSKSFGEAELFAEEAKAKFALARRASVPRQTNMDAFYEVVPVVITEP